MIDNLWTNKILAEVPKFFSILFSPFGSSYQREDNYDIEPIIMLIEMFSPALELTHYTGAIINSF